MYGTKQLEHCSNRKKHPHVRLKSTPKSRVPPNLYFRTFCRLFVTKRYIYFIEIWKTYTSLRWNLKKWNPLRGDTLFSKGIIAPPVPFVCGGFFWGILLGTVSFGGLKGFHKILIHSLYLFSMWLRLKVAPTGLKMIDINTFASTMPCFCRLSQMMITRAILLATWIWPLPRFCWDEHHQWNQVVQVFLNFETTSKYDTT